MMRIGMPLKILVLVLLVFALAPSIALGAGIPQIVPTECRGDGGCQSVCSIANLAQNVLNAAIYIAVVLSAVLFAWAGFLYLTNVGNSGGVSKAKEVFFNVLIGLCIILASWLVIDVLMHTFVSGDWRPWNAIC